jgi:hypothetical protein
VIVRGVKAENVRQERKMSVYHIFRKPVRGKNGCSIHRWYYYWIDSRGKQMQRVCRGCQSRPEAEAFVRELPPPEDAASL